MKEWLIPEVKVLRPDWF